MMRRLLFLLPALLLTGCAGRYAPATLSADSSVAPAPSFADQVAALPEGSTQYFAESPFGPSSIEAGPLYLSGLGNECRSARAASGTMSHRFAVCREQDAWRFIPTVFESMPR